jgi:hypothetical protein
MTGLFQKIENWIEIDLATWLGATAKVVVADVVSALAPLAQEAVSESLTALVASNGDTKAFIAAVGPILTATAEKAEAAAIKVSGHDLLLAVGAAIANAAPPPVVAPATAG